MSDSTELLTFDYIQSRREPPLPLSISKWAGCNAAGQDQHRRTPCSLRSLKRLVTVARGVDSRCGGTLAAVLTDAKKGSQLVESVEQLPAKWLIPLIDLGKQSLEKGGVTDATIEHLRMFGD